MGTNVGGFTVKNGAPGWTGHVEEQVTVTADAPINPPVRLVVCTAPGNFVFLLPDGSTVTLAMAAKDTVTFYAVQQVVSAGASGTYLYYR